ncbi:MAG TPA: acetyl-CoA hydrolase/transferase C-terminal domain-containing protein [Steroidobacteraceae bacterium]|nr:acetyl-CoA hydrolase/transferase C-terminal domain-containing protein [Steroidobacteraceae bacterium]HQX79561.1 acetyl-CoA hydrolase/transferase C-terminal domain-containing protein [Steroidobacteraceae bacterium]
MSDAATAHLDLAAYLRPGDMVVWGQAGAEPLPLIEALVAQRHRVGARFRAFLGIPSDRETILAEHADCIDLISYCGTGAHRALITAGALDILPCHYSGLPDLLSSGPLRADVLLLQVAPADEQGRYSFSLAHEYLVPLLDTARVVIVEVNRQAPWTYGERHLIEDDFDIAVHTDRPLPAIRQQAPGAVERAIAGHVSGLVEDGATLQAGLGAIPEAILDRLTDHRDLGVHSGAIGDAVARLTAGGVVTNARKTRDRGFTVAGVALGGHLIYEFIHRNPAVQFRTTRYTHDAGVLASIERFVALNSAIEVDLTGQVNAEQAAGSYVGAVGGAADFLRGAARSRGGLPIVALPSLAGGRSRIVSQLSGPVSTSRADAGLIVTEHGVADLRGQPLSKRIRRMIDIAAPQFRAALEQEANT